MKKWVKWVSLLLVIFVSGMLTYRNWLTDAGKTSPTSVKMKKNKILYWTSPMDPNYRSNKPGKSPMGMDLIPVYADQHTQDKDIVTIPPQLVNNLGVRTAVVSPRTLPRTIDTVGYVTANEDHIEHVNLYTSGWIRKLYVSKTGEVVKKGQILADIYSPILNNAQEEYLLALKNKNAAFIDANEKKLLTLGVSQQQINLIKQTRKATALIPLYVSKSGIIASLNIREGIFVKPDVTLMTIEDLSSIWIIAEVFDNQSNWVEEKQPAIATLSYLPGKVWRGQVDYVYPQLDPKTHTLRVRLFFTNPDLTLKPDMYANVKIFATPVENVLAVPFESLIRTGEGDRVILALGNGKFRAQAVSTGIESGNWVAILSGLKAGDKIVTSAQFLIDSESNLEASLTRISTPPGRPTPTTPTSVQPGIMKNMKPLSQLEVAKKENNT